MGLAVGALVMDPKTAAILGSVITLAFLLAGGYYIQHVPGFISWIKYISISHYTYKLFLGSQYRTDDTYACSEPEKVCRVGDFPAINSVGLDGQFISAVALVLMLVVYKFIAYMALTRIGATPKLEK
ncbi:hypothetical protein V6N13_129215 [Hibiscus sabdariffa]